MIYKISATIMANRPTKVIAIVVKVTPIETEFNSLKVSTTLPDNLNPRMKRTTPGMPNKNNGCLVQYFRFVENGKVKREESLIFIFLIAVVIKNGMNILGVSLPEKM